MVHPESEAKFIGELFELIWFTYFIFELVWEYGLNYWNQHWYMSV